MFGIGFFEVILLLIVALVVLGPERLPEAIRVSSIWIGRFKRKIHDIREEVEKEVGADDIRQTLHNEHVLHELKKSGYDAEGQLSELLSEERQEKHQNTLNE